MVSSFKGCNPWINGLVAYKPGKPISELKRESNQDDIIKLASNENPLGPSPLAIEYIKDKIFEINYYPDGNGFELKSKLSKELSIDANQIFLGNGSDEIFTNILKVYANYDSEVIVSEYGFSAYGIATIANGSKLVVAKSKEYGTDLNAIIKSITEQTKVIFIANPNNPTGTYNHKDEMLEFLENVPNHIIVVIDEAYFEYMKKYEDYVSAISYIDKFNNLIVTRTFSKAYGLAGLRVGYSISCPLVCDLLNRVRLPFNVNSLALDAATIALDDHKFIDKVVKLNEKGMSQLTKGFDKLEIPYIKSVGNFVSIDVGSEANNIYNQLLGFGIIVRPLEPYKMNNFLRITVGLDEQNKKLLSRLSEIIKSL